MDLFGRKKRRRERIEDLKATYRAMPREARRDWGNIASFRASCGLFRNNHLVELFTAMSEVEREECPGLTKGCEHESESK